MTSIDTITLEVADPAAAHAFYASAFGLGDELGLRRVDETDGGFRGFSLSLIVAQPADVEALFGAAIDAGASALKSLKRNLWGYGGVVSAPDGTIWKIATSKKRSKGPSTGEIDDVVLLLGSSDVLASKRFYVEHGLEVAKSFGRRYVEFAGSSRVKLALYGRRALAKDVGVTPEGEGPHRIVIGADAGSFTDPDGFAWEPARARAAATA